MKTLILLGALALTGCCNDELSTNSVSYYVKQCNSADLDYDIIYNERGKATDVVCYKPGANPLVVQDARIQ